MLSYKLCSCVREIHASLRHREDMRTGAFPQNDHFFKKCWQLLPKVRKCLLWSSTILRKHFFNSFVTHKSRINKQLTALSFFGGIVALNCEENPSPLTFSQNSASSSLRLFTVVSDSDVFINVLAFTATVNKRDFSGVSPIVDIGRVPMKISCSVQIHMFQALTICSK